MDVRVQVLFDTCRKLRAYLPSIYGLTIFAFATATVLPLIFWEYGGDVMFQYVGIQCFANQFWSGDLYPRWCFDANAGLGAPVFVYYPPLGFYVAALLYPLYWAGLSVKAIYLLSLWVLTGLTGYTAWRWLSGLTHVPQRALFLTLLYLWLPYRMELMMFRAAYGELWCMAFLPLVLDASRKIVQGERKALFQLALGMALCFLSNMPAAVIGVLASGTYMVAMLGRQHIERLSHYALGFVWAVVLAGFYLGPAILYKPFITTEGVMSGARSWSNDYLSMANITEHGQGHVVIAISLTVLALVGMIGFCAWHRAKIHNPLVQREWRVWSGLSLGALFLMFPASSFIWGHAGFIAMLAFPWRMQLVIAFAIMYLAFVIIDQILPVLRPKARPGDVVMPFAMLGLIALFVISAPVPDFVKHGRAILQSHYVTQREYRTIWTDKPYITMDYILARWMDSGRQPYAEPLRDDMAVTVLQWNRDVIELEVSAQQAGEARLALQYFPMWQMEVLPQAAVTIIPEKASGQMLLSVPEGKYNVRITNSINGLSFWKIIGFYSLSFVAMLAWLGAVYLWPRMKGDA